MNPIKTQSTVSPVIYEGGKGGQGPQIGERLEDTFLVMPFPSPMLPLEDNCLSSQKMKPKTKAYLLFCCCWGV